MRKTILLTILSLLVVVFLLINMVSATIDSSNSYIIITPNNISVGDEAIITLFIKASVPNGQFNGSCNLDISDSLINFSSQSFSFKSSDFLGSTPTSRVLIYSWNIKSIKSGNLNISARINNSENLETNIFSYNAIINIQESSPPLENELFCGDGKCNNGESCSSCSSDCGACSPPPSGGGGGGGSNSGGGNSGGGGGSASGGGGGGTSSASYVITNEQINIGYSKELGINDKLKFEILNDKTSEQHSLSVDSIGTNFANITVQSNPIKLMLFVGQEKKLNLSSSENYDLSVKLENITNKKAIISVKKINEPIVNVLGDNQTQNNTNITQNKTSLPSNFYDLFTGSAISTIGFAKTKNGIILISVVALGIILIIILIFLKNKKKQSTEEKSDASKHFSKK